MLVRSLIVRSSRRSQTFSSMEREPHRAAIWRSIKSDGFDFVKVYSGLPRDIYFAIVDCFLRVV